MKVGAVASVRYFRCSGGAVYAILDEINNFFRRYVRTSLEHPNIVGVHWHQFSDQATAGRFDGENMQVGWTDVCDTPYWETVEAVRDIGSRLYEIRSRGIATRAVPSRFIAPN